MTKETLYWMSLSSLITSHIFFSLNFDEHTGRYFGRLPESAGYIIPWRYVIIIVLYLLNYIQEEKIRKEKERKGL
ncbi:hypothetical protein GCM10023313_10500 [Mucilaginibacter defluvii]|uniref:Uncharacterized protein n=1 Tax=Mucilaginibacter defluvii TaxID=1196019 RepID=A0ABP9FP85_9SPHI